MTEEELRQLRRDAQDVQALTEAPGNDLPDAVFNLMAAVLRHTDNSEIVTVRAVANLEAALLKGSVALDEAICAYTNRWEFTQENYDSWYAARELMERELGAQAASRKGDT